ncbi:MAG: hypothetical protein QXP81_09690, partial [Nitrososphaerota archaeon]
QVIRSRVNSLWSILDDIGPLSLIAIPNLNVLIPRLHHVVWSVPGADQVPQDQREGWLAERIRESLGRHLSGENDQLGEHFALALSMDFVAVSMTTTLVRQLAAVVGGEGPDAVDKGFEVLHRAFGGFGSSAYMWYDRMIMAIKMALRYVMVVEPVVRLRRPELTLLEMMLLDSLLPASPLLHDSERWCWLDEARSEENHMKPRNRFILPRTKRKSASRPYPFAGRRLVASVALASYVIGHLIDHQAVSEEGEIRLKLGDPELLKVFVKNALDALGDEAILKVSRQLHDEMKQRYMLDVPLPPEQEYECAIYDNLEPLLRVLAHIDRPDMALQAHNSCMMATEQLLFWLQGGELMTLPRTKGMPKKDAVATVRLPIWRVWGDQRDLYYNLYYSRLFFRSLPLNAVMLTLLLQAMDGLRAYARSQASGKGEGREERERVARELDALIRSGMDRPQPVPLRELVVKAPLMSATFLFQANQMLRRIAGLDPLLKPPLPESRQAGIELLGKAAGCGDNNIIFLQRAIRDESYRIVRELLNQPFDLYYMLW